MEFQLERAMAPTTPGHPWESLFGGNETREERNHSCQSPEVLSWGRDNGVESEECVGRGRIRDPDNCVAMKRMGEGDGKGSQVILEL